MARPRLFVLLLALHLPALATPRQTAMAQGAGAQAAPQASDSVHDPVLLRRPPAAPATMPSPVTAEGRIHLDVLVSDAAGKPVPGLGPQDFAILDNSQPRRLLSFRSFDGITVMPRPPVEVILLIDTANLPFQQVAATRQQIANFLGENGGHLAQPVSLMVLSDGGLRIQPRPSVDGNALITILDQVKGSIHAINPAMGVEGELERMQLSLRQLTAIADNEAARPGRKLLIWVGPGWPMLESKAFQFSDKDQRRYFDAIVELSTRMREARMALYSVALSDSALGAGTHTILYRDFLKGVPSPRQADTGNLALKVLALQSGGRVLGPDNNLAAQINACVAEANAFYALSFNPPPAAQANEYHDLKVEVAEPGLTARTSTGYYNQPVAESKLEESRH